MNTAANIPVGLSIHDEAHDRSGATASTVPQLSLLTSWTILRFTFGLVPIVAGVDKFTNLLTNWESYLNPFVLKIIPIGAHAFMGIAGIIEIAAGSLTLARPRLGGYIVAGWLVAIALSLITSGRYLDIAVRDLVMAIGAFTLANLSAIVAADDLRRSA